MASDEAITLCTNVRGDVIQRARPGMTPGSKFVAVIRGVMTNA